MNIFVSFQGKNKYICMVQHQSVQFHIVEKRNDFSWFKNQNEYLEIVQGPIIGIPLNLKQKH